jgi:uracil-DNA glycosylase family 4
VRRPKSAVSTLRGKPCHANPIRFARNQRKFSPSFLGDSPRALVQAPLAPPRVPPYLGVMGIAADISEYDWEASLAALAWQADLGVTEVTGDAPIDRYELAEAAAAMPAAKVVATEAPARFAQPVQIDTTAIAAQMAASCTDLVALRAALDAFEHCELKKGARNLVFSDGNPAARLMIVGEVPERDEDIEGKPFVGRAGQLLDRMLAAIGLSRSAEDPAHAVYITSAVPWRPPSDRELTPTEIAMLQPFLAHHIAIAKPDVIITMGNTPCAALLGKSGILRLRGTWAQTQSIAVMPMTHPTHLLRNPAAKREAWADLLAVKARLARG